MYAVEKLSSYITRGVYTVSGPFHPFGGAVDIIVVQQPDGSFKSSPWYVRFGKFQGVLKTREKVVTICVNGVEAGFHMYLDHKGEAYFLKDAESDGDSSSSSSSLSSGDEKEEKNLIPRIEKSQSCNIDADAQIVMGRSRSRRSAIFGYMFGRRSMKDNGNDVERMSSMERAEIAADLLEMKWSTNLAMDDRRVDDALGDVVTADTEGTLQTLPDEKVSSRGEGVDSEEVSVPNSLSLGDDEGIRDASLPSGLSNVDGREESVDCCDRELMGDSFRVTVDVVSEVHIEKRFTQTPERRIREEIVEITTLETGNLSKRTEVVTESKEFEVSPEGSVLKSGSYNVQSGDSSLNSHDLVQALRESYGASAVEKEGEEVVSIRYSETLESSNEREALDPLFGTHEQCGQQCEGICNTTEMISEVKSQPESSRCKDEEDVDTCQQLSLETSITEDPSLLVKPQADWPSNEAFEDAVANDFCSDSSMIGTGQTHDKETKNLAEEQPSLELIVSVKSQPEMNGIKTIADSLDQVQEVANVGKPFEGDSSCLSNGFVIAQEVDITPMSVETVKTRVPSSESSEDDQFLFSDIDGFGDNRTNPEQSSNDATVEAVDHTLLYSEGDIEEHEMKSLYDEQSGESIHEMPRTQTSPITIPRTRAHLTESELLIRSVPIIRSHIHDLEASNLLHPLSCSLNMSEKIEQGLPEKEAFKSSDLEADSKSNTLQDHHMPNPSTAVDDEKWEEQKDTPTNPAVGMIDVNRPENNLEGDDAMGDMVPSGGSWKIWPFTFRKSKTITTVRSIPEVTIVADTAQKAKTLKMKEQSLTPTSEELASLNLKEGPNVITFTFSTAMLGRQQVDAMIYLWKWNTHVVISDVDGTITKSDVLGQFMPLVGIDWSQTGVAHLFSAIKENGYQLLFLSARAISQAYITRQFLFNLKQDGKALPDGPVVISPDGLFPSLYREVIRRAPHEFKISCLEGIRALFPPDSNPFYAGFGNRDTDEISYLKVGIPKGKIFIINPKGEVAVNRRVDTKSYSSLHAMVNGMFPPMSSGEQEDFNSWNYWKLPLVGIDA